MGLRHKTEPHKKTRTRLMYSKDQVRIGLVYLVSLKTLVEKSPNQLID